MTKLFKAMEKLTVGSGICFLLFAISTSAFGQIAFEKGYFIANNGQKTECLIKNRDWKNNPNEFIYKLEENGEPQKQSLETVKEFGIIGFSKYIRETVKVDRSSKALSNMTIDRNPIWSEEQVFLKVIVEGEASLYYFEDRNVTNFFYSVADSAIEPLIYKHYLIGNAGVGTNYRFRQQLWNNVRCENTSKKLVEKIEYKRRPLEKYFIKYNECIGNTPVVYNRTANRDFFNLTITPGINYSSLSIMNDLHPIRRVDFGYKLNFRVGLEAEFIFPFNRNKWSVIIEPTFQYFSAKKDTDYGTAELKYPSVNFPIGARYYLFLNKDAKLFVNLLYNPSLSIDFNATIDFESFAPIDIFTNHTFGMGFGARFGKISSEIRYYMKKELIGGYKYWTSDYDDISFIIGYRLF